MEFPNYVPSAVRAHLSALMDGSESEPQGWAVSLADIQKQRDEIDETIKTRRQGGETHKLNALRRQKADVDKRHDQLASDVDCLTRLAHDPRMQEAYIALSQEFTKDYQWRAFTYAAWAARDD